MRPGRGWPAPTVYGHEAMPDHFRRYERTLGWNTAINQRQFGLPVDRFRWPNASCVSTRLPVSSDTIRAYVCLV